MPVGGTAFRSLISDEDSMSSPPDRDAANMLLANIARAGTIEPITIVCGRRILANLTAIGRLRATTKWGLT